MRLCLMRRDGNEDKKDEVEDSVEGNKERYAYSDDLQKVKGIMNC